MCEMRINKPDGIITVPIERQCSQDLTTPIVHTALLKANSFGSLTGTLEELKLQIRKSQPSNDDESVHISSPLKLERVKNSTDEYK
jgi:hypothetical protein